MDIKEKGKFICLIFLLFCTTTDLTLLSDFLHKFLNNLITQKLKQNLQFLICFDIFLALSNGHTTKKTIKNCNKYVIFLPIKNGGITLPAQPLPGVHHSHRPAPRGHHNPSSPVPGLSTQNHKLDFRANRCPLGEKWFKG